MKYVRFQAIVNLVSKKWKLCKTKKVDGVNVPLLVYEHVLIKQNQSTD